MDNQAAAGAIRAAARTMRDDEDVGAIVDLIGDARIVLLGEATHGTQEFYRTRAAITLRLIAEKGFDAIAAEADWPDALRVSRFLRGDRPDRENGSRGGRDIDGALAGFRRFPRWMWRNTEILALIEQLREHNAGVDVNRRIGFFGLDLYSLRASMEAVVGYLDRHDPQAAAEARRRYACFDHFAEEPQHYGYAVASGEQPSCEDEAVRQLLQMSEELRQAMARDAEPAGFDELFYAEQNARVARNAEAYYRAMFSRRDNSWNVRDTHMADTLDTLCEHLSRCSGRPARLVVWAHNSHIGDARATEMSEQGECNVGQLVRERHGTLETFLVGFSMHAGTVTAASDWNAPAGRKTVLPSREDSYERLFHDTGLGRFVLPVRGHPVAEVLARRRLQRAIGVVYRPQTERMSHYYHADLSHQFDAIVHIDSTRAVQPLDRPAQWERDRPADTYPSGI
ncbi:MAG: erythromycin esterase family protein [Burkholderiaceae bacterium]